MVRAIVHSGTKFNPNDLPLPRKDNEEWGLYQENMNIFFSFKTNNTNVLSNKFLKDHCTFLVPIFEHVQ